MSLSGSDAAKRWEHVERSPVALAADAVGAFVVVEMERSG
jgi:hypothetical protein